MQKENVKGAANVWAKLYVQSVVNKSNEAVARISMLSARNTVYSYMFFNQRVSCKKHQHQKPWQVRKPSLVILWKGLIHPTDNKTPTKEIWKAWSITWVSLSLSWTYSKVQSNVYKWHHTQGRVVLMAPINICHRNYCKRGEIII